MERHLLTIEVLPVSVFDSSHRLERASGLLSGTSSLISITHTTHSERYKSHTNTKTDMKRLKVQRYPLETDPALSGPLSSMAFQSWSIHSCLTSAVSAAYQHTIHKWIANVYGQKRHKEGIHNSFTHSAMHVPFLNETMSPVLVSTK